MNRYQISLHNNGHWTLIDERFPAPLTGGVHTVKIARWGGNVHFNAADHDQAKAFSRAFIAALPSSPTTESSALTAAESSGAVVRWRRGSLGADPRDTRPAAPVIDAIDGRQR